MHPNTLEAETRTTARCRVRGPLGAATLPSVLQHVPPMPTPRRESQSWQDGFPRRDAEAFSRGGWQGPGLARQPARSLSPGHDCSIRGTDLVIKEHRDRTQRYENICVQPWKEKAESGLLRQHDYRRNAAFARRLIVPQDERKASGMLRQPPGAARNDVSAQVLKIEQDLQQHRKEIEDMVRTALKEQMHQAELNDKLKETLCYSCWVNWKVIMNDEAFQVDAQTMLRLRKLLDKFEARSENLRTRTAFEAASHQISLLQRQLSASMQKCNELQAHVELLQKHVLASRADLKTEKRTRKAECDLLNSHIQQLQTRLKAHGLDDNLVEKPSSDEDVGEPLFSAQEAGQNGNLAHTDCALPKSPLSDNLSPQVSERQSSAPALNVKPKEDEGEVQKLRSQLEAAERKYNTEKREWGQQKKALETRVLSARGTENPSSPRGMLKVAAGKVASNDSSRSKKKDWSGSVEEVDSGITSGLVRGDRKVGYTKFRSVGRLLTQAKSSSGRVISSSSSAMIHENPSESEDDDTIVFDVMTGLRDTSEHVRNRNRKYVDLGAVIASFGSRFHSSLILDRYFHRRSDVMLRLMESEFNDCIAEKIIASKYGGVCTTLRIEWDFVMNPQHTSRLAQDCERFCLVEVGKPAAWPNATTNCSLTGDHLPQRVPVPLEYFTNHLFAGLANLTKAEVAGLRLYTGFAYGVINAALRAALHRIKVEQEEGVNLTRVLSRNHSEDSLPSVASSVQQKNPLQRTASALTAIRTLSRTNSPDSDLEWDCQITRATSTSSHTYAPECISYDAHQLPQNNFTATASSINSGLKKLQALSTCTRDARGGCRLYRGLSKVAFDSKILQSAESCAKEATELMVLRRCVEQVDAGLIRQTLGGTSGTICGKEDREDAEENVARVQACLRSLLIPAADDYNSETYIARPMKGWSNVSSDISPTLLNPTVDMSLIVLGLQEHMDEKQIYALISSGLQQLQETPFSEQEQLALQAYTAGQRNRSFVESAFTSCTPDLHVALQYATNEKCSMILEIETGELALGASLAWVSQFPAENERAFLALSAFEVVKIRRELKQDLVELANFQKEELRHQQTVSDLEHMIAMFPRSQPHPEGPPALPSEAEALKSKKAKSRKKQAEEIPPFSLIESMEAQLIAERQALDELRDSHKDFISSRSKQVKRSRFNDYVNVITVNVSVHPRAMTSDELYGQRQRWLLDFGNSLVLEAQHNRHCGHKIASKLSEKMSEFLALAPGWFDQMTNLHASMNDLLETWQQVVKREKHSTIKGVKIFLDVTNFDDVNHVHMMGEVVKLFALCESHNPQDKKEYLPIVMVALARVATVAQKDRGADAVLQTIFTLHDSGLLDNVARDILQQAMEHVLNSALETEPVLEVLFSDREWSKLQSILPGTTRRQANEDDIEPALLYIDAHYKMAPDTVSQGFKVLRQMLEVPLEDDDKEALFQIRTKIARHNAIPIVVQSFAATKEWNDGRAHEKPEPLHSVDLVRMGCKLLELLTSTLVVHEDNVKKCEQETITRRLLQVLDNSLGDEVIIEAMLHLLTHFDFELLEATSTGTPYKLRRLLKEAAESVNRGKLQHQTITKQVSNLLDKAGSRYD